MNVRQIVAKAPNSVLIICGTVMGVTLVGGVVATTLTGHSADPLFQLINLGLNMLAAIGSLGAIVTAAAAGTKTGDLADKVDKLNSGEIPTTGAQNGDDVHP